MTPAQLAAVIAGGGHARCEDPTTHVVYHLIQQTPAAIDDQYVREKVAESFADAGEAGFEPWDMDAVKAEVQRRIAAEPSPKR